MGSPASRRRAGVEGSRSPPRARSRRHPARSEARLARRSSRRRRAPADDRGGTVVCDPYRPASRTGRRDRRDSRPRERRDCGDRGRPRGPRSGHGSTARIAGIARGGRAARRHPRGDPARGSDHGCRRTQRWRPVARRAARRGEPRRGNPRGPMGTRSVDRPRYHFGARHRRRDRSPQARADLAGREATGRRSRLRRASDEAPA